MSQDRKLCCLRLLKRSLVLIVVLSTGLFVYMSLQYNLTEFAFIPAPLTKLSENVKTITTKLIQSRNGSDVTNTPVTSIDMGVEYKLLDLPFVERMTSSNSSTKIHEILWYNRPSWVDINFGSTSLQDRCAYKNCYMSSDRGNLTDKSALVFCLTESLDTPPTHERPRDQAWIVFWMESPRNIDGLHVGRMAYRHKVWRNTMNWTMSYRTDSDIFYPYGALTSRGKVSFHKNYGEIYDNKDLFAAWIVSNCHPESRRERYVNELRDHGIHVDIHGRCGEKGRYRGYNDLKTMLNKNYKFYLSFENSICKDYVTEKFFRYFNSDVILVVRGGTNYSSFFPPKTFIDTNDFSSAQSLANYLKHVASNRNVYIEYLKEKDKYISNEMFHMTNSFCRICEKLNDIDDNRKMIEDIIPMLHDNQCRYPTDLNTFHHVTGYLTLFNCSICVLLLIGLLYCYIVLYRR